MTFVWFIFFEGLSSHLASLFSGSDAFVVSATLDGRISTVVPDAANSGDILSGARMKAFKYRRPLRASRSLDMLSGRALQRRLSSFSTLQAAFSACSASIALRPGAARPTLDVSPEVALLLS